MLEARKLSAQMHHDMKLRFWAALSLLIWSLCTALLISVWLGAAFEPPVPDTSQDKMAQEHVKAVEVLGLLKNHLAPEQELTPALFEQIAQLRGPLEEFAQSSATGLHADKDSRDAQIWPGRANLILDDVKALLNSQEAMQQFLLLREPLTGLYKPKGPVNAQKFSQAFAARGFYLSSLEWVQQTEAAPGAPKITWALLGKGKASWQQLNSQMDALEVEFKLEDDMGRSKIAHELLTALSQHGLKQAIKSIDQSMARAWSAQDRLLTSLDKLPAVPQVVLEPVPWSWSQLAFPGTTLQGLLGCIALMMLGLAVSLLEQLVRRHQMHVLSLRWLTLAHQLESAVRGVGVPLSSAVNRIDALSSLFAPMLEKLRSMQELIKTPPQSPQKTLEEEAWRTADRMQAELEGDLSLLREKLLNIHLQFCSGQTHENLVYDLAFTTEAMQTIYMTARDLGRSFALLQESLRQVEPEDNGDEVQALIAQVDSLKTAAKKVAINLQEVSGRLQVAVEDVPQGKRFENAAHANLHAQAMGRPRGNEPV